MTEPNELEPLVKRLRSVASLLDFIGDYTDAGILRETAKEIARLRAIVDRLPTTTDGVTVLPGDTVYAIFGGDVEEVTLPLVPPGKKGGVYQGCYSTYEAAAEALNEPRKETP